MKSHKSKKDDSVPETGGVPETGVTLGETPLEPSSVPPAGEPIVSASPVDEPTVSASPVEEPIASASPVEEPIASASPADGSVALPVDEPPVSVSQADEPLPADEPTISALPKALPASPSISVRRVGRSGAAGWALLLALASLVIAGFALWQAYRWHAQGANLHKDVETLLAKSDKAAGESRASALQERERLDRILVEFGALEGQVNKSEGHAKALEALYEQFSRSQEDRIITEVRQAVEFADQQLQYAGNIETALIALRGAKERLEQNDHGQFASILKALETDIEELSQQGTLDVRDTAFRLEQVLEKIDKLPLNYFGGISAEGKSGKSREKEEGEGFVHFFSSLVGDIWEELRSMVTFERLDTTAEPVLLAPEQSAFLRENLKIRLLTARLAMLARDKNTYETDLEQARSWINRFFDTGNKDVNAVIEELDVLKTRSVGIMRHKLNESPIVVLRFQTRGGRHPPMPSLQPQVSGQAETPKAPETTETPKAPEEATETPEASAQPTQP